MQRLDLRGQIQPFSFLIISQAFKEVRENETLEILLSGPQAVNELFKILPAASYIMLLMESQKDGTGIRLQIKKTVAQPSGTGFPRTGELSLKKAKEKQNDGIEFKRD